MWRLRRARLQQGGQRAGRITSGASRSEREREESAWGATARLPALAEEKHAQAHGPLRAPKIKRTPSPIRSRAHRRAPRALRPGTRAVERRGGKDTCAHSAAQATPEARRVELPCPSRPLSPPSVLYGGPGRLLRAPRPTVTYWQPSPPELRTATYRPRGPVQA